MFLSNILAYEISFTCENLLKTHNVISNTAKLKTLNMCWLIIPLYLNLLPLHKSLHSLSSVNSITDYNGSFGESAELTSLIDSRWTWEWLKAQVILRGAFSDCILYIIWSLLNPPVLFTFDWIFDLLFFNINLNLSF